MGHTSELGNDWNVYMNDFFFVLITLIKLLWFLTGLVEMCLFCLFFRCLYFLKGKIAHASTRIFLTVCQKTKKKAALKYFAFSSARNWWKLICMQCTYQIYMMPPGNVFMAFKNFTLGLLQSESLGTAGGWLGYEITKKKGHPNGISTYQTRNG